MTLADLVIATIVGLISGAGMMIALVFLTYSTNEWLRAIAIGLIIVIPIMLFLTFRDLYLWAKRKE